MNTSLLSDQDIYLFNEGSHFHLYEKLGAHPMVRDGVGGVSFAVWAPNAERVSVIGDFNGWDRSSHRMIARDQSGIWEIFIPNLQPGVCYKYFIESRWNGYSVEKADPMGLLHEMPPKTASVVWQSEYEWNDASWMRTRAEKNALHQPMSIYEVHLGSWMHVPEDGNRSLNYREAAVKLGEYLKKMNYTHVELLPIMEHPFYASWGYQITGYFAPTSRFGNPDDFRFFVDYLHQLGIGVILDWVPSHFPNDQHGLSYFDGTHLYEHADPRKGFHPDWKSAIFNYGRHEVRSFLISSAFFWLDQFHIDGLRVDAVASMLYLDYSRKAGEWEPNPYGGNENLEAISFLRRFNEAVYAHFPGVVTIAEESTAWPMVSRPTYIGGLGFGLKWDMGWMHDTLGYMKIDPVFRKYHQNTITFRMLYAFNENFVLPLSHDEVVHGKGSLIGMMSGVDDWQKFANLRILFGYMYAQPGKKLMFMGGEFGQRSEWNHNASLEWHVLEYGCHSGLQRFVEDLNKCYRDEEALHQIDFESHGFQWIDCGDWESSIISFLRRSHNGETIVCVCNFTPVPRYYYRVGVPQTGYWKEILNSDSSLYGGSGQGNAGGFDADPISWHGQPASLNLTLPPLSVIYLKHQ